MINRHKIIDINTTPYFIPYFFFLSFFCFSFPLLCTRSLFPSSLNRRSRFLTGQLSTLPQLLPLSLSLSHALSHCIPATSTNLQLFRRLIVRIWRDLARNNNVARREDGWMKTEVEHEGMVVRISAGQI